MITLHEAIEKVLKEAGKPLRAKEIAEAVNNRQLYDRGDKEPVPASQIHARVNKYPGWFTKTEDGLIWLCSDRQDTFNDAVSIVFDNLKSHVFIDNYYIISSVIFYKRWLDYPELLSDYQIIIEINEYNRLKDEGFLTFYNELKEQLEKKDKYFDLSVLDILFKGQQDLFKEVNIAVENTLRSLATVNLDNKAYSVSDFGKRFSGLFTRSYINIQKIGEYSTPNALSELMIKLANADTQSMYYNPAAGYFTFPASLQQIHANRITFYGEEIDRVTYSMGLLNLIANGASIENAYLADSLASSKIKDESADVVICNPPFYSGHKNKEYDKLFPYKSSNFVLYFLQLALRKTKTGGTVVIVIPESILFAEDKGIFQFRKYLINNNLVEAVISLPSGIFEPYSMVKSSILILKKERAGNKILFFDADKKEFFEKDHKGKESLQTELVFKQIRKLRDDQGNFFPSSFILDSSTSESRSSVLKEEQLDYYISKPSYVYSTNENIQENDFNLQVKRYFINETGQIVRENGDGRLVELKNILKPFEGERKREEINFPYCTISNLNSDFTRFIFEQYDHLKISATSEGQIVDMDILMVGSIESRLKPTFFRFIGKKILISRDIYALVPDLIKIDPEYLVYELASIYVNEQVKALSQGTTIKRIRLRDFLRIKIKLPDSIEEQKKIVKTKKEALVQAHQKETENLAERLKVSAANERKMLGAFKHELTPLASSMKGDMDTLNKYLFDKIEKNTVPQWIDKISKATLSRTLEELILDIQGGADELLALTENISQILDVGREEINFEEIEIKHFIKEQVAQWKNSESYNIVFNGEQQDAPDVKASLNKDQFAILIRNFLDNTQKHGYQKRQEIYDLRELTGPNRNIVFNAFTQEDSIIIELINDGDPFPADFTFDDFISFGGHSGLTKGSGIGGFLMNKIVQNHNGHFKMLESGRSLIIPQKYKTSDNRTLPFRQIIAGVYFRIILPKNKPE